MCVSMCDKKGCDFTLGVCLDFLNRVENQDHTSSFSLFASCVPEGLWKQQDECASFLAKTPVLGVENALPKTLQQLGFLYLQ